MFLLIRSVGIVLLMIDGLYHILLLLHTDCIHVCYHYNVLLLIYLHNYRTTQVYRYLESMRCYIIIINIINVKLKYN